MEIKAIILFSSIPAVKNAVNLHDRIDKLVYIARRQGRTINEINDCINNTTSSLSTEQRLNELIG